MSTSLVVMGVSGSGKTTIGEELSRRLGWEYAEGDDFHPAENVAKMRSGQALTDEDRRPWLARISAWIARHEDLGKDVVVTCSALKVAYRDLLRHDNPSVFFVHVDVARDVLEKRLSEREGHYMPASLLESQLSTLEPLTSSETGATVPGDEPAEQVVASVLDLLHRDGRAG